MDSSKVVYDRNGELIYLGLTKDDKYRVWTSLGDIGHHFVQEILNKEDKYFWYHMGINPISLLRSTLIYFSGKQGPGASTVTMQLARLFYQIKTRSLTGKLKQIALAFWLELKMSKNDILEAYLNLIPTGGNREGIETAALFYFHKNSQNLNQLELTFLLELPQRPARFKQFLNKDYKYFISKFLANDKYNFTEKELFSFLSGLKLNLRPINDAPHFNRKIIQEVNDSHIYSSLDKKFQLGIKNILNNYVSSQKTNGIHNGTALIIDNRTGEILTYLGSNDFYNNQIQGQVDGLSAKRSPGSTLKPFIYGLAFDQGLIIPQSIVFDGPLTFRTPENYDREYQGEMTIEQALITSRNVPAVEIYAKLKSPNLVEFLESVDIHLPFKGTYYGSALALGGAELSSLDLAKAYMSLANNGAVKELTMLSGALVAKDRLSLLSSESNILVKDILSKNPRPYQKNINQLAEKQGEVYWKTGTSIGFRDAWAVGIWGNYTIITWFGDFTPNSNNHLIGSQMAGPFFFQVVDFLRSQNLFEFKSDLTHLVAKSISEIDVCAISGHRPNKHCPHRIKSLYIPGVSPLKSCLVHQEVLLTKDGHRACSKSNGKLHKHVLEIYSNEKLRRMSSIGLPLTGLPKFDPICSKGAALKYAGEKPVILSPRIGYTYVVEPEQNTVKVPINLKLFGDSHLASIYIDNKLVKKVTGKKEELVNLKSGSYILKVIDDRGRSNSRVVNVMNVL